MAVQACVVCGHTIHTLLTSVSLLAPGTKARSGAVFPGAKTLTDLRNLVGAGKLIGIG